MPEQEAQFAIDRSGPAPILRVTGDWTIHTIGLIDAELRPVRDLVEDRPAIVDVSGLMDLDTAGAYVIEKALQSSVDEPAHMIGNHPVAGRMLAEVRKFTTGCDAQPEPVAMWQQLLERVGRGMIQVYEESIDTIGFFGETVVACGKAIAKPSRVRWLPTFAVAESAGLNAVPIVMTLSFFIGAVIDDGKRLNAWNVQLFQFAEHVIFALCKFEQRLFNGDYMVAKVGKSNGVTRKSLRQSHDVLFGTVLQRQMPRQIQQCWFCRGSRDV